MRTGVRWIVGIVVVLHGLIHLLGAAKGLDWFPVTQLRQPISSTMGVAWLAAATLLVVAGVMLIRKTRGWWIVGAAAAALSQAVILTSWTDAKAGTVPNLVLLLATGYGFAAQGPKSYGAQYRRRVDIELAEPTHFGVVTEADLAALPEAVADYVRQSGALGESRVLNLRARIHGRIRAGASKPWMRFTGEQVNIYGLTPSRLFLMDATMFGLPVDVLHVFVGPSATMRVKLCSLLPMVNAAGPDMDRGETVTLFNDLCVLAPPRPHRRPPHLAEHRPAPRTGNVHQRRSHRERRARLQRRSRTHQLRLRRPVASLHRRPPLHPAALVHPTPHLPRRRCAAGRDLRRSAVARPRPRRRVQLPRVQRRRNRVQHRNS